MAELGNRRSFVVHGTDGLDEVTLSAPTIVWEVRDGRVKRYLFDPGSAGFEYVSPEDIRGGDAATNAGILKEVLSGKPGPAREAVLVNAAFAIVAAGKAEEVREGAFLAARSIDSGAAMNRLREFLEVLGTRGAI